MAIAPSASFGTGATTATSISIPSSAVVTESGVLCVILLRVTDPAGRTVTVSDGVNTYLPGPTVVVGGVVTLYSFYAYNASFVTSVTTITASVSGGAQFMRIAGATYTGLATTNALDQTSTANGTGTSVTAANITTTQSEEVIIAMHEHAAGSTTFTVNAPFVQRVNIEDDVHIEDRIVVATGTYAMTGTLSGSAPWGNIQLSFSDTPIGGGGAANPPYTPLRQLIPVANA